MANLESELSNVAATMPEPQEHAIAAEAQAEEKAATTLDNTGTSFDPAIHESGPDGAGLKTTKGAWKRRRGRKSGPQTRSTLHTPGPAPGALPATEAGKQIAETIFAAGQLIGGEEWAPVVNAEYGINERLQMHEAWQRYCEAKGMDDIPPGVAVSIAMFGYIGPRMAMPKTKSRMQKAKEWGMEKYLGWKRKRRGEPDPPKEAAK